MTCCPRGACRLTTAAAVILALGLCLPAGAGEGCKEDINGNGFVEVNDLVALIVN